MGTFSIAPSIFTRFVCEQISSLRLSIEIANSPLLDKKKSLFKQKGQ